MPNQPEDLSSFVSMCRSSEYLILDTETSGLKRPAEVVELSIISSTGEIMFWELIRPINPYGGIAAQITGITADMLANRPTWLDLRPRIEAILKDRDIVVYNATFDRHMFRCSDESNQLPVFKWSEHSRWWCAMKAFAEYRHYWDDYHGNWAWAKLTEVARFCNVEVTDAHRAVGDCLMTALVVKHMIDELKDLDVEQIAHWSSEHYDR